MHLARKQITCRIKSLVLPKQQIRMMGLASRKQVRTKQDILVDLEAARDNLERERRLSGMLIDDNSRKKKNLDMPLAKKQLISPASLVTFGSLCVMLLVIGYLYDIKDISVDQQQQQQQQQSGEQMQHRILDAAHKISRSNDLREK
jgi:hypothetical protein